LHISIKVLQDECYNEKSVHLTRKT